MQHDSSNLRPIVMTGFASWTHWLPDIFNTSFPLLQVIFEHFNFEDPHVVLGHYDIRNKPTKRKEKTVFFYKNKHWHFYMVLFSLKSLVSVQKAEQTTFLWQERRFEMNTFFFYISKYKMTKTSWEVTCDGKILCFPIKLRNVSNTNSLRDLNGNVDYLCYFADEGSGTCKTRPPCSKKDFFSIHTACDNYGKVRKPGDP